MRIHEKLCKHQNMRFLTRMLLLQAQTGTDEMKNARWKCNRVPAIRTGVSHNACQFLCNLAAFINLMITFNLFIGQKLAHVLWYSWLHVRISSVYNVSRSEYLSKHEKCENLTLRQSWGYFTSNMETYTTLKKSSIRGKKGGIWLQ